MEHTPSTSTAGKLQFAIAVTIGAVLAGTGVIAVSALRSESNPSLNQTARTESSAQPAGSVISDTFAVLSERFGGQNARNETAVPEVSDPNAFSATNTSEAWPESTATSSSAVEVVKMRVRDNAQQAGVKTVDMTNTNPRTARMVIGGTQDDGRIVLAMNKATVVHTNQPVKRVSVGQAEIADVNPLGPDMLLVTAKQPGTTQLVVWNDAEQSQLLDVVVNMDLGSLEREIQNALPGSNIAVSSLNGSIVLRGTAPSLRAAEQAVAMASPFGEVLNFVDVAGGQQIMLKVQFAEVSKTVVSKLGVNIAGVDGISIFGTNVGNQGFGFDVDDQTNQLLLGTTTSLGPSTLFGAGQIGSTSFQVLIDALRESSLLRILSEPSLTVLSGEDGEFLAGGEVPVPVPSENGIAIEYREFGVKLNYTPVALGNGMIRLKLNPEVSELDYANGTTIAQARVPGIRKRSAKSTVELAEGQTIALAGLLSSDVVASKEAVPLLGDIPVLGALFRSVRYQRRETELIVLITPVLVSPMNPGQVPPLPGSDWRHPEEAALYLNGDIGEDRTRKLPPPELILDEQGAVKASRSETPRANVNQDGQLETRQSVVPPPAQDPSTLAPGFAPAPRRDPEPAAPQAKPDTASASVEW